MSSSLSQVEYVSHTRIGEKGQLTIPSSIAMNWAWTPALPSPCCGSGRSYADPRTEPLSDSLRIHRVRVGAPATLPRGFARNLARGTAKRLRSPLS